MKKTIPLAFIATVLLVGCGDHPSPSPSAANATTNNTQSFEVRGVIRNVPEDGATLLVRHEAIPDYMPKMTMELNVRNTNETRGLKLDDEITFRLVVTDDTHWMENIRRIGHVASTNTVTPAIAVVEKDVKPGDVLPDFEMLDERGRKIRLSDFRGQVVAFSLFFIRCPIPDFCPLMNKNFTVARQQLTKDQSAGTNWLFLSLSFDAEFDTPAMLQGYADSYRGEDTNRWLFASVRDESLGELAMEIDFMFSRENGTFSHNLRTVVLDAQGRIHHIFTGNKWKPSELADEMKRAQQVKP